MWAPVRQRPNSAIRVRGLGVLKRERSLGAKLGDHDTALVVQMLLVKGDEVGQERFVGWYVGSVQSDGVSIVELTVDACTVAIAKSKCFGEEYIPWNPGNI